MSITADLRQPDPKKDKRQIGNQVGDMGNTFYCRAGDMGNTFYCRASATTGDPDITQPATTGERRLANALSHRAVGIATGVRQFLPGLLIHAAASGDHVRSSNFGEFVQWNPAIDALYW